MNKNIKRSLIIVLVCLIIVIVASISLFYYSNHVRVKSVDTVYSPNGEYTLVLQQVGQPYGLLGPVDANIILKKNEEKIEKHKTSIHTDGAQLNEFYWDIEWLEDKVVITLLGEDGSEVINFNLP